MADQVPVLWTNGLAMVCLRCAGKLESGTVPGGLTPDGRTELRQWLRERLMADGLRREVRIVETSCLGICPPNSITVALSGELAGETGPRVRVVGTPDERERLYQSILAAARATARPQA